MPSTTRQSLGLLAEQLCQCTPAPFYVALFLLLFVLFLFFFCHYLLNVHHNMKLLRDLLSLRIFFFFFKLGNIVLVLPYIDMDLPWVYMCSPS